MSVCKQWGEVSCRLKKSLFNRIAKFIKQVWHGYGRWRMLRKHCRLLLEMNDYNLKDIGISRADAVRYSRQRDSLWKCIFKNTDAADSGEVI